MPNVEKAGRADSRHARVLEMEARFSMRFRRTFYLAATLGVLIGLPLAAGAPPAENVDLDAVFRIKEEGLTPQRSKVMEIESYLTDVYGPRLTGSPNIKEAGDWAQKTMKEWGLANVHVETWPFGRGWQNQRFVAQAVTPRAYPLTGFPKAWTPGTNGPVTGDAVFADIRTEKDFDTWRGKLRGKYVLTTPMRDVDAHFEPLGHRFHGRRARRSVEAARGSGRTRRAGQPNRAGGPAGLPDQEDAVLRR